jgi:hypothetical protein
MYRSSMRTPSDDEGRPTRTFLAGVLLLAAVAALLAPFLQPFEPIDPRDPPALVTLDIHPSTGVLALGLIPLALMITWGVVSLRRRRGAPVGPLLVPAATALALAAWTPSAEEWENPWEETLRAQSAGALVLSALLCVACVLHAVPTPAGAQAATPPRVRRRMVIAVVLGLALIHAAVLCLPGARAADLRSLTLIPQIVAMAAMLHAWNAASKGALGDEYDALARVAEIAACGVCAVYLAGLSEYILDGVTVPWSYQTNKASHLIDAMSRGNRALLLRQRGAPFLVLAAVAITLAELRILSRIRWKDHLDALARRRALLRDHRRAHALAGAAVAALLAATTLLPTAKLARTWDAFAREYEVNAAFLPADLSLARQRLEADVSWPPAPLVGLGRSLLTVDGRELGPVTLLDTAEGRERLRDPIVAATVTRVWPFHAGPSIPDLRQMVVAADRGHTVRTLLHLAAVPGEPTLAIHLVHTLDPPLREPWPLAPGRLSRFHPAVTVATWIGEDDALWRVSHVVIEEAGALAVRLPDQTWTTLAALHQPPDPPQAVILVPDEGDTVQEIIDTVATLRTALSVSYVWLADPALRARLRR